MNVGVGFSGAAPERDTTHDAPVVPRRGQREMAKKPVLDAMNEQAPAGPIAMSPQEATDAIEDEVYAMHSDEKSREYRQKMLAVQKVVKGPRNAPIRHAVLRGHISPEDIVSLDAKQLEQRAKEA